MKQKDLPQRYGTGTYAVITGGSDGLGWSLAKALAAKGFNIVLLARNEDKLKDRCSELKKTCKVKSTYIVADFTKGTTTDFYEGIFDKLKDLPISILVNNVGIGHVAVLPGLDTASVKNVFDETLVNMMPQVMMTKILFQKLDSLRGSHKSIVIDISSIASLNEVINEDLYSATKTFNRAFTACMHEKFGQEGSNIEWFSVKPGYILTSFGNSSNQYSVEKMFRGKSDGTYCFTPDQCAESVLRCMGNCSESYITHWKLGFQFEVVLWFGFGYWLRQFKRFYGSVASEEERVSKKLK